MAKPDEPGPETAEEFLDFHGVAYDPALVRSRRLHVLRRFHDLLRQAGAPDPAALGAAPAADLLRQAYEEVARGEVGAADLLRLGPGPGERTLAFGGRRRKTEDQ